MTKGKTSRQPWKKAASQDQSGDTVSYLTKADKKQQAEGEAEQREQMARENSARAREKSAHNIAMYEHWVVPHPSEQPTLRIK